MSRPLRLLPPSGPREADKSATLPPGPLAAAVRVREAPPPGAVGQRQQQEQQPTDDEDAARTAETRHGPGELVVEGDGVVAGQEGQDGLVEDDEAQQHQDA